MADKSVMDKLIKFEELLMGAAGTGEDVMPQLTQILQSVHENFAEKCGPSYQMESQRLEGIVAQYRGQCRGLKEQLEKEVVREEYSTGGMTIHRGYYCPSPVRDIIVGGSSRGRLLKRMTVKSNPAHRYGFNTNDELVIAYTSSAPEIIIRQGQTELGFLLASGDHDITTISESLFRSDGKIASYAYAVCCPGGEKLAVHDYQKEIYTYSDEGLLEAVDAWISYTHHKYHFRHDDEGYLSSFTFVELDRNGEISFEDDRIREVKIKRKV